jgi:hypothetical protein
LATVPVRAATSVTAVGASDACMVWEISMLPSARASSNGVPSATSTVATSMRTGSAEAAARSSAPLT